MALTVRSQSARSEDLRCAMPRHKQQYPIPCRSGRTHPFCFSRLAFNGRTCWGRREPRSCQ
eukprot:1768336-Pyramimonas_sp.AAC.1